MNLSLQELVQLYIQSRLVEDQDDPKVIVVVLGPDRETFVDAALKPLSELAAQLQFQRQPLPSEIRTSPHAR